MVSQEERRRHIKRKKRKLEQGLDHPELPILEVGKTIDSEGTIVSYGTGWMTGKVEDLLRKVFSMTTGELRAVNIHMNWHTIDSMANAWYRVDDPDPAKIEYIPPQDKIGKWTVLQIFPEEMESLVGSLSPETGHTILLQQQEEEFLRIAINI